MLMILVRHRELKNRSTVYLSGSAGRKAGDDSSSYGGERCDACWFEEKEYLRGAARLLRRVQSELSHTWQTVARDGSDEEAWDDGIEYDGGCQRR